MGPIQPEIPGLDTFSGDVIHSAEYGSPTPNFRDKRVLVVGVGNSGVDIVSDAAFHAHPAYLSTRRRYWFVPKLAFYRAAPGVFNGQAQLPSTSVIDTPTWE
ncbi:SidA/IucD/PvdA family monooxygenase [Arthrobacter sp. NPDC093128]|uniref:SidA/IucD/PvdA family monooxygenase n=1 Tax=Arthrobacter sp. NPDC093128 TaxID=3154979 RepID=UPI0034226AC3